MFSKVNLPNAIIKSSESLLSVSNVIWTLFFGWWLYLVYVIVTIVLCISIVGFPYAKITWMLKDYYWWPFGKYIIRRVCKFLFI